MLWYGTLKTAAVAATGNSGWIHSNTIFGANRPPDYVITGGRFRNSMSGGAGDGTLQVTLNAAFDAAGSGDFLAVDMTEQNTGNSWATKQVLVDSSLGTHIPPYWKITWTVTGTPVVSTMTFFFVGALELTIATSS